MLPFVAEEFVGADEGQNAEIRPDAQRPMRATEIAEQAELNHESKACIVSERQHMEAQKQTLLADLEVKPSESLQEIQSDTFKLERKKVELSSSAGASFALEPVAFTPKTSPGVASLARDDFHHVTSSAISTMPSSPASGSPTSSSTHLQASPVMKSSFRLQANAAPDDELQCQISPEQWPVSELAAAKQELQVSRAFAAKLERELQELRDQVSALGREREEQRTEVMQQLHHAERSGREVQRLAEELEAQRAIPDIPARDEVFTRRRASDRAGAWAARVLGREAGRTAPEARNVVPYRAQRFCRLSACFRRP